MAKIKVTVKKNYPAPRAMNSVIVSECAKRMNRVLDSGVRARRRYMQTWDVPQDIAKFKPELTVFVKVIWGKIRLEALPAESATLSVWELLRGGTSKRPMIMTDDFLRKTSPGALASRPGRGRRSHIDIENPAAGIEARDQDRQINEELTNPLFLREMDAGMRAGFRRMK